jgi:phosphatidylserine/phosphatidylglycerophosphate/cardiolipin synthase-like enzyme
VKFHFSAGLAFAFASAVALACSGTTSSPSGTTSGDDGGTTSGDDGGTQPGDDGGTMPGVDASTHHDAAPPPPVEAGAPPPLTSAVSIIVEPSDRGQALIDAINGARTSVHMTMYLLSSSNVINALIGRHNAGLDVKVLLNKNFPPNGGSNASVFSQLSGAGVNVQWAPTGFTYTHEKTVILDGTTAWIMTMNATQTSPADNREYLAVDTDATDVHEAETIFESDWANVASSAHKLVTAPDNATSKLVALIASATRTIDIEAEELSDVTVTNALASASDHGVHVRIVLASGSSTPAQTTAIATLKQHGVQLVSLSTPYIHAKSLVVDGSSAYVGSENFSTGSLRYNRELGVLFNAQAEVQKVLTTTSGDFARGTPL